MEAMVLVATDDVEGKGWAVPGRVFVRHHELKDAAADGLALLQQTGEFVMNNFNGFVSINSLLWDQ